MAKVEGSESTLSEPPFEPKSFVNKNELNRKRSTQKVFTLPQYPYEHGDFDVLQYNPSPKE